MKAFLKFTLILGLLFVLVPFHQIVYAQASDCSLLEEQYEPISLWDPNINTLTTAITDGMVNASINATLGDNTDNLCECVNGTGDCPAGYKEPDSSDTGYKKIRGSLAGISTYFAQGLKQPLPLDTAYAWNQAIEKVPFARTALAAPEDYSGPLLEFVYGFWEFVRDIAFGIMAIVMLVVGIMLMTQRKVGPQASVSLQLALPRIAIALVLISFSYVIGATGASLAYNLGFSVEGLVKSIALDQTTQAVGITTAGLLTIYLILVLTAVAPAASILLFLAVTCVVALVMYLLALVAFAKVYMKMLVSIVAAPISFSLGAIPGNEAATTNWFKSFGAYLITLPAMNFVLHATWAVGAKMIGDLYNLGLGPGSVPGGLLGGFLGILIFPIILIFGFSFARTVPEKIQTAIVGGGPKGGKK